MEFFNGKKEAEKLDLIISHFLEDNPEKKSEAGELAIVNFEDNLGSLKYSQLKKKYCENLGLDCKVYDHRDVKDYNDAVNIVKTLSEKSTLGSLIIQLPLPNEINYDILSYIPIDKDVDTLNPGSQDIIKTGKQKFLSPIIRSFLYFINYHNLDISNLKVSIIGKGALIGIPLSYYFASKNIMYEFIDNYEKGTIIKGDIVILGAGVANLIKGEDMKRDAYVIDFGSSIIDGKTVGDLDIHSRISHLNVISKSPGGLGPLVVRFLIMNHLRIL